jgi:hypothetical protein
MGRRKQKPCRRGCAEAALKYHNPILVPAAATEFSLNPVRTDSVGIDCSEAANETEGLRARSLRFSVPHSRLAFPGSADVHQQYGRTPELESGRERSRVTEKRLTLMVEDHEKGVSGSSPTKH